MHKHESRYYFTYWRYLFFIPEIVVVLIIIIIIICIIICIIIFKR